MKHQHSLLGAYSVLCLAQHASLFISIIWRMWFSLCHSCKWLWFI